MPWKETGPVEERQEFIRAYLERSRSLRALCLDFGISRKTGYKWISRFVQGGMPALVDRSRARHSMAHKTPPWTEELIVALRKRYPRWGPKKLVAALQAQHPAIQFPAPSTAGHILRARGLVQSRRYAKRPKGALHPFEPRPVAAPNSTWCADFKGHVRLRNGAVCYPATLTDAFSRKILRCQALSSATYDATRLVWISALREYGLPSAIRTDNGVPFAAPNGFLRLSLLALFLIELGIDPEFIEPGNPQQMAVTSACTVPSKRQRWTLLQVVSSSSSDVSTSSWRNSTSRGRTRLSTSVHPIRSIRNHHDPTQRSIPSLSTGHICISARYAPTA